jgi:hypothetical protein
LSTPEELHAYLSTNPGKSYADLSGNALDMMRDQLRSGPSGFTPQQRAWLARFYLVVPSQATLDTITDKLPPTLGLNAQATNGGELVLPASLLTDCLSPTDTWNAIASDLAQLEIRAIAPDQFPIAEEP